MAAYTLKLLKRGDPVTIAHGGGYGQIERILVDVDTHERFAYLSSGSDRVDRRLVSMAVLTLTPPKKVRVS